MAFKTTLLAALATGALCAGAPAAAQAADPAPGPDYTQRTFTITLADGSTTVSDCVADAAAPLCATHLRSRGLRGYVEDARALGAVAVRENFAHGTGAGTASFEVPATDGAAFRLTSDVTVSGKRYAHDRVVTLASFEADAATKTQANDLAAVAAAKGKRSATAKPAARKAPKRVKARGPKAAARR